MPSAADAAPTGGMRAGTGAAGRRSLPATAVRLARYLRPHRPAIVLGVVAFFAAAAIDPLVPAFFKQLLDRGFTGAAGVAGISMPVWVAPVVVVALFVVRGVLSFSGTYLFAWATSQAVLALRTDLIRAVMRADAGLYTHLSPGVAASRVINDPQNATQALAGALTTLLRDGTTLLALLGYLLYLNPVLTAASMATAPLLAWVVHRVQRRTLALASQSYESQVRLVGIVDDIARAWRVVRTFDAGAFEQQRFRDEAQRLRQTTLKAAAAGALMTPLTQAVASLGVALIIGLALAQAGHAGTTVGEFVAFITALLMTISPLRHLTDLSQPIVGGLVQARACFDLIDTPPEEDRGWLDLEHARGELRFEHVTVIHPGSPRPALADLDLHVPAGSSIALVGASGSGKTTVVSTLLGFVAPAAGRVRLDGIDIRHLRKAALRRQFAVVSQDIVLFDGSIEDNVAYALPRDPQRVRECLAAADLWDFVQSLPQGVATLVGTNGSRLSGGQRQRLAIARALYKDAGVWVFDEATSALDAASESAVHRALERWRRHKTLVLIAHRLSTVRHADRIVVLRDGRVQETGSHDELMRRQGAYAGIVRAQALP